MAENEPFNGKVIPIDIGLSATFEKNTSTDFFAPETDEYFSLLLPRREFAHKGNFGHGAIVAGSVGMMGAAILAARAFLQSGAGKLTCHVPACGYEIMQTSVPEAMCEVSGEDHLSPFDLKITYDAIGIGPGSSIAEGVQHTLLKLLKEFKGKLVLDADALNIIAKQKELMSMIPADSILTPHPGEFDRLFGSPANDFERLKTAIEKAKQYAVIIVLKGHRTAVVAPDGKVFFNQTGNSGMAKPGMGDVLTGLITGLVCQGYQPLSAAKLGVYLHGLAGDITAEKISQQAMTASDLTEHLRNAWKKITVQAE